MGLKNLVKSKRADIAIANGENAADGFGLTPELAATFFSSGVDVITSGNHIWQKKDIYPILESNPYLLRPANYPSKAPGRGYATLDVLGISVGVMNLQGRQDMPFINCPFQTAKNLLKKELKDSKVALIDFHAESPEEKEAFALYLDGQVSAVVGTHTHVQTADERILPGGCAYITDLGMTGPEEGVIGSKTEIALRRSMTQLPLKLEIVEAAGILSGVVIEVDSETGKALEIERFRVQMGL